MRVLILSALVALTCWPSATFGKVKVVATLPDLGAVVRAVGGDDVEVTTLVRPVEDPHFVDPKPSFLVHLRQADLLVVNGLELEAPWLNPLISNSRNPNINLGAAGHLDVSLGVRKKGVGLADRAQGDVHPAGNPHFLYDPREVLQVAATVAQRLAQLDPAHGTEYIRRAKVFRKAVFMHAKAERQRFAVLPPTKRRVVSYHRSLAYLADWLGLQIVAELEPKPGIPPTPAHLARVIKAMRALDVKLFMQETYYPSATGKKVAQMSGATYVSITPSSGQGYLENLKQLSNAIYQALKE
jgi:zinc/manganese transport system substrate-binding protein